MIAWWMAFFYMSFMITAHSEKGSISRRNWKYYVGYLLVFISSAYALNYSPIGGTAYLIIATYMFIY